MAQDPIAIAGAKSMGVSIVRETARLPRAPEEGVEILAIGDIHGRSDLFDALLAAAATEPRRAPRRVLVLLGDLVDRGPDSLGVLKLARQAAARVRADETIALMGNHEAMMRLSLDPEVPQRMSIDWLNSWAANGGTQVVQEIWPEGFAERDLSLISKRMRAEVPSDLIDWLRNLRACYVSGGLLFVHAGINPAIDFESFISAPWMTPMRNFDESRHWAWVREPFLRHRPGADGFSGYFVVHGHTPRDAGCAPLVKDQIARFRLNLDAGSFYTGEAKLALIRGAEAEVWTAKGEPRR